MCNVDSKVFIKRAPRSFLPNGYQDLAPGVFQKLHSKVSTRSYYSGFIQILAPGPSSLDKALEKAVTSPVI